MKTKYRKGDKLWCIDNYLSCGEIIFKKGNTYEVCDEHFNYPNCDHIPRNLRIQKAELGRTFVSMWESEVNKNFINLSSRLEKLKKINQYGKQIK